MSEEYQSPYVSSSVHLDDMLQASPPEGAEKADDDLLPLKPGAGDAPAPPPPVAASAPRASETVEDNDVTRGTFQDDSPPPLPARSRPEPETLGDTELAKRRPPSTDESFFSPSVTPELVMQPADFVNLKDQPSSGKPVDPQDGEPVHVEPVPVFSMPSFSSDSITELMTAKTVNTDLVQPEVPVNKILPSISSVVEKQRTDNLEKVHTFEKVHVKPAIRKSSEIDMLISVDECSFQCNEHQCVESNESELGRTASSLVEETVSDQNTADKEGLLKISQNASIGKVQVSNEREVELGPHLSLCEYVADPKMNASPLTTIVQENKSMCDILDFEEQTLKANSGLNFCYGDSLEMKERNGLNSCSTCHDDAIKSIDNLTVKSENAVFPGQEVLDVPCDSKKQIVGEGNEKQDHADVETFAEQLFEQGGKQSPNDAYFVFSQVPFEGEPQVCMTYATFDSSMLACPQSDQISKEMISAYELNDGEKTELKVTSKLPLLVTIHELEVTKNIEDETKSISLINSGNEHVEPDLVMKTDSLAEDIGSEQTAQNFALHQSEGIFQNELCEMAVSVEKYSTDLEMRKSTSDLLNSFEPLQSTLEQHAFGISEDHSLTDMTVKAPSFTNIEGVKMIEDPDNVKVQFDFQNERKEQTEYASIHETTNGTGKVAKRPHLLEEQKTVSNRVEDPFMSLESIPISQDLNLTQQLLVDHNKEPVIKDEDLYKHSGYQETDVSSSLSVGEPSKHELISNKSVEEKWCLTSLAPTKVSIDTSVTVKKLDKALSNEITSSKSEPVANISVLGDTTIGMKLSKKILTDYKLIEQCSPRMPSVQDQTETPTLVKNVTEDDLDGPVKVTDKATVEIVLSHQEASGALLPISSTSENCTVEESLRSLIEDFSASIPPSVLSEDLSTMGKRLPLQTSEETCLNISKSFTSPAAPLQDKFLEYSENANEIAFKTDGNSEIMAHAQIQIMPHALPMGVSFPLNEEVTKASKEVVTKILETSVALAEVLGDKEGTRAMCMSQQETCITSVAGEDDVRKKNIPVESMVPELTVAKSTETSKDSTVADISVKQDKNSGACSRLYSSSHMRACRK
ncbi:uncharacterized protein [Narcine bancroftii]|uniref:uncharacterized protein isoform X2 n=1 Tax=Narcine bancroftii TaxID=1343680 RepID=UPI00383196DF